MEASNEEELQSQKKNEVWELKCLCPKRRLAASGHTSEDKCSIEQYDSGHSVLLFQNHSKHLLHSGNYSSIKWSILNVYMRQPVGYVKECEEQLACKQNACISQPQSETCL